MDAAEILKKGHAEAPGLISRLKDVDGLSGDPRRRETFETLRDALRRTERMKSATTASG